ncbi:MAG: S8 family serine peptidase, partial [Acidimicrobiaceae bacterium]|nr:S8 family serine peptidase [Acidimicrobiaceae bacterium]
ATYALTLRRDTTYKRFKDTCKSRGRPPQWEDELSGCQWHLHNDGRNGRTSREDINVLAAHDAGFLGDGVAVQVVDDGIDLHHEDLVDNTNNAAESRATSLCVNDPAPFTPTAKHGTAVAGIVAGRDNTLGMRGVAPRAQVYNIRFLTCIHREPGYLGRAMAQNAAKIAVSVSSWGKKDSPAAEPIQDIWRQGLEYGLQAGFGGKGTSYVFAAGNGNALDYATLEEFATHRGTIPVCAVDARGKVAGYSERGPNLWVCGPGNDTSWRWGIATLDLHSRYRDDFGGTSAAAPAVGGVVALMRAANPDLTWRDVKLILAETARRNHPTDSGWAEGAPKYGDSTERHWFNNMYGFGMVDAYAAVQSAQNWTLLPPMLTSTSTAAGGPLKIPADRSTVTSTVTVSDTIEFVEYVEINTNFNADDFRHLDVELVSPSGTVSLLSPAINFSPVAAPLKEAYRFGSAKHLGESAAGTWTLRITDRYATRNKGKAVLTDWNLAVYGNRRHPSAPMLSSVTPGPASLAVAWQAPSESGATALTGYELRHISSTATDKTDDTRWDVVAVPGGAVTLAHTLSFTTAAGSRDIQVRAVNSAGAGPWSATVTGTPGTKNLDAYFVDSSTIRTVAENTAAGTAVGAAVTATDSDTAPPGLTYTLSGTHADSFTIDGATGQLRTKAALDYETQAAYSVTVSVSDGLNLANEADPSTDDFIEVNIEVSDVDEPHNQTCTPADKPAANGHWVLAEPLPAGVGAAGRLAVGSCTVADPEGGSVSWQVTGPDRTLFGVGTAGTVSFNNDPDYEAPGDAGRDNIHNFTVSAVVGLHTSSEVVTVQVTDVDEPPTISPRSCVFSVPEDASVPWSCSFALSDPEDRTPKEDLTGPDAASFDLTSFDLSGGGRGLRVSLKSSVVLDYETKAA